MTEANDPQNERSAPKRQSLTDPEPGLSKRQSEVLERVELGRPLGKVAKDLGLAQDVVERIVGELRGSGHLPEDFQPKPNEGIAAAAKRRLGIGRGDQAPPQDND